MDTASKPLESSSSDVIAQRLEEMAEMWAHKATLDEPLTDPAKWGPESKAAALFQKSVDDLQAKAAACLAGAWAIRLVQQFAKIGEMRVMVQHPFGSNLIEVCAFCRMGPGQGHAEDCLWESAQQFVATLPPAEPTT